MMTSQGCPYKCAFCAKNYKTVRLRNLGKVFEEIAQIHLTFGYNAIAFPEDIFILYKTRVEKICNCLKEFGIIWRCLVRADLIVKYGMDFLKIMADSGCIEVGMGIESGSDEILETINKGETVDIIKTAIKMLKDSGIKVKGFFIVGLPGESQKTLDETRKFLEEISLEDVDIKIFQPYPGSPIWDNKEYYDIQWNDIDYHKMFYKGRPGEYYGNIRTKSLTTEQIYSNWVEMENTYKWHKSNV